MEEVLLTGTDQKIFLVSFSSLPPMAGWRRRSRGGPFIMAVPCQTPASSSGKRRCLVLKRPVDLQNFFCKDVPTGRWFLLMSSIEEGNIFKNVSSCKLAWDLEYQIRDLQSVSQQWNSTLLLEGWTDQQISKIKSQVHNWPYSVEGGSPFHLKSLQRYCQPERFCNRIWCRRVKFTSICYIGRLMASSSLFLHLCWLSVDQYCQTIYTLDSTILECSSIFQIPCAVSSAGGSDILRSTVCPSQFVWPVARRHTVSNFITVCKL